METFVISIVVGAVCVIIGILNMRGNISSIHWYHRQRVTEENKIPFGRIVGSGTIICGVSLVTYGCFSVVSEKLQNDLFVLIGAVVMIIGLIAGLGLSFYAMIKYNKGIF